MRISKEERLGKQELRLLEYLENNRSINPIMSWQALGIYRLSDVVFKLRNRGYDIETKRKTVMNKWQEKTSFAEYKLERAS
jgi:hypothetical protein|tara:strand:- start:553 stop:795 length:243 start_codon:yes stop_codon:yes gene_type:complete